jgi:hypothetical protein
VVTSSTLELFPQELAHRSNDGVEVWLLWHSETNRVSVSVHDAKTGESFEIAVSPEHALDAFNHPYADAAVRQTEVAEPVHA